jgi:hypothetical protein
VRAYVLASQAPAGFMQAMNMQTASANDARMA